MSIEPTITAGPGRIRGAWSTLIAVGLLTTLLGGSASAMTVTECEAAAAKDGLTSGRAMDDYVRRCIGAAEEKIDGTAEKRASKERAAAEATDRSESVQADKKVKPAARPASSGERKASNAGNESKSGGSSNERKAAKAGDRS